MDKGIYELFATHVANNPTKVAVVFQQQSVTYDELNQQVIKLTSHFLKQGVTLIDPSTVFFSADTKIGNDVIIHPNVQFGRKVKLGNRV